MYLHTNVNNNTTTQDIGQGSNSIHIKWNAAKQSEFVQSFFGNETTFGELDSGKRIDISFFQTCFRIPLIIGIVSY